MMSDTNCGENATQSPKDKKKKKHNVKKKHIMDGLNRKHRIRW